MLLGLGIDVVEIARIQRILDGPPGLAERFLARCFTAAERAYCDARLASDRRRELSRLLDACKAAAKLGIEVAAGHGLNYENVVPVAAIPEIEELNIGHAIVARAVLVGFERAVREMKELLARART